YGDRATFFMIGPHMKDRQEIVKRITDEEFGIGLHGITHDAQQIYETTKAPAEEMLEDQQIVEDITGVHTELIRLPYGSIPYLTNDMRDILYQQDFKIWDWNVDSRYWEFKG